SLRAWVKATAVYWANSTGRCNTLTMEVLHDGNQSPSTTDPGDARHDALARSTDGTSGEPRAVLEGHRAGALE
ncbi:MAG: hypothetical protein ACRD0E_11160, partial [Acidimicrobiales bacterium]